MSDWLGHIIAAGDDGFSILEWIVPLVFVAFAFFGKFAETFKDKFSEKDPPAEGKRYKPLGGDEDGSKRYKLLDELEEVEDVQPRREVRQRMPEPARAKPVQQVKEKRSAVSGILAGAIEAKKATAAKAGRVRRAVAANRERTRRVSQKPVRRAVTKVDPKVERRVSEVEESRVVSSPLEQVDQGDILKNAIIYSEILGRPLGLRDDDCI